MGNLLENVNLELVLGIAIGVLFLILIGAVIIYFKRKSKEKPEKTEKQLKPTNNSKKAKSVAELKPKKITSVGTPLKTPEVETQETEEYQPQKQMSSSDMKDIKTDFVENFMEFDEISDNMIVQNNGDKYIMVIKCQGINYDLMSANEMVAVEEGFIQFLNTLRFPIQLYVQTSSLDLTDSLKEYNARIDANGDELEQLQIKLKRMEEFDEDNVEEIDTLRYEIKKKRNIYEYGKDIVQNVERISKNKSILQQNYYIVVPYYLAELGANNFKKQELKEMAFSELYTRCKGLIGSLKICSVEGKILNSFELAELLHLAYNRDEGEIFSFRNALEAQYDRLYHTAPDVLDKKIALIEENILEKAAQNANEEIIKASGLMPGDLDENNETIQRLIYENQKQFIKDYNGMIPTDTLQTAVENTTEKYKERRKEIKHNEEVERQNRIEESNRIKDKARESLNQKMDEEVKEEVREEVKEEIKVEEKKAEEKEVNDILKVTKKDNKNEKKSAVNNTLELSLDEVVDENVEEAGEEIQEKTKEVKKPSRKKKGGN